MSPVRRFLALATLLLACLSAGWAVALDAPGASPILKVTGDIAVRNAGDAAVFDLAMLEALPQRTTTIETPWTKGTVSFSGPLASALLDAVGAKGTTVRIKALNGYTSELPIEDLRRWPVILATRLNGAPMSVREKGPLFLIYPWDAHPDLYNEVYFARSVWQIASIDIR